MKDSIRRLPDAEQEVMQAIWACTAPVARTDIEEILFKTHPMAMTTLLTLLTRLSEKGFITIEKNGRRSYYTPCISQEDYLKARIFLKSFAVGIYQSLQTLFVIAD